MNAPFCCLLSPAAPLGADNGLTADELAELAREDAEYEWREEMREIALHHRDYRDGVWDLDDWLEFSSCGRGYAAAHARDTFGMGGGL